MLLDPVIWAVLALLGGWTAADGTGAGQVMVARPLVAATLAGWVAGDPLLGVSVGLLLEVFHLSVLPVGAARYPDGGPAAVAAGGAYAAVGGGAGVLLTVLVFFIGYSSLAGASVRWMRRVNSRLVLAGDAGLDTELALERRHLGAIALDLLRGALLVAVGIPLLHGLLHLVGRVTVPAENASALALRLSFIALLAGASYLFGGRSRLLAAGAVAGLLLAWARA
jgi:mannose/fructose/N-acetylgalactosamine-specific phosphotransferase system component IIC